MQCNLLFERGIVEELLDEIHVSEQHAATTITLQAKSIKSITFLILSLEQPQVSLPLVSNHFSASETPNRNDHGEI